jgi:hypothetical protein
MTITDTPEQNEKIESWDWEYDDNDTSERNYWEDYTPGEDL